MAKRKWIKTAYVGVRCREHSKRKHGVKRDRYFSIRYRENGKLHESGLGWSTDGWTAKKASLELAQLKQNAKTGEGPLTLAEKRNNAEQAKQDVEQARIAEEKAGITFDELFNVHYIPFTRADGKKSWGQEVSLYKTWMKKHLGEKRLVDISPIDIEQVKHAMVKKDRSERTIQYCLAVIKHVFNFAIMRDLFFGENPTKKVKSPYPDNARVRFFSRDEADEMLLEVREKSPQLSEMAEVSLYSGLRWGEVAGLLWQDVDVDQGTLFVRDPKNKHSRTVPMPKRLQKLFKVRKIPGVSGYVFPSKNGDKSEFVSKTFARVIADMGLNDGITDRRQKLSFHSCRHSFCSWLAMEGVPLHTIGQLAGHRTLHMTQRYAHLAPDTLKAAVSILDQKKDQVEVVRLKTNGKG